MSSRGGSRRRTSRARPAQRRRPLERSYSVAPETNTSSPTARQQTRLTRTAAPTTRVAESSLVPENAAEKVRNVYHEIIRRKTASSSSSPAGPSTLAPGSHHTSCDRLLRHIEQVYTLKLERTENSEFRTDGTREFLRLSFATAQMAMFITSAKVAEEAKTGRESQEFKELLRRERIVRGLAYLLPFTLYSKHAGRKDVDVSVEDLRYYLAEALSFEPRGRWKFGRDDDAVDVSALQTFVDALRKTAMGWETVAIMINDWTSHIAALHGPDNGGADMAPTTGMPGRDVPNKAGGDSGKRGTGDESRSSSKKARKTTTTTTTTSEEPHEEQSQPTASFSRWNACDDNRALVEVRAPHVENTRLMGPILGELIVALVLSIEHTRAPSFAKWIRLQTSAVTRLLENPLEPIATNEEGVPIVARMKYDEVKRVYDAYKDQLVKERAAVEEMEDSVKLPVATEIHERISSVIREHRSEFEVLKKYRKEVDKFLSQQRYKKFEDFLKSETEILDSIIKGGTWTDEQISGLRRDLQSLYANMDLIGGGVSSIVSRFRTTGEEKVLEARKAEALILKTAIAEANGNSAGKSAELQKMYSDFIDRALESGSPSSTLVENDHYYPLDDQGRRRNKLAAKCVDLHHLKNMFGAPLTAEAERLELQSQYTRYTIDISPIVDDIKKQHIEDTKTQPTHYDMIGIKARAVATLLEKKKQELVKEFAKKDVELARAATETMSRGQVVMIEKDLVVTDRVANLEQLACKVNSGCDLASVAQIAPGLKPIVLDSDICGFYKNRTAAIESLTHSADLFASVVDPAYANVVIASDDMQAPSVARIKSDLTCDLSNKICQEAAKRNAVQTAAFDMEQKWGEILETFNSTTASQPSSVTETVDIDLSDSSNPRIMDVSGEDARVWPKRAGLVYGDEGTVAGWLNASGMNKVYRVDLDGAIKFAAVARRRLVAIGNNQGQENQVEAVKLVDSSVESAARALASAKIENQRDPDVDNRTVDRSEVGLPVLIKERDTAGIKQAIMNAARFDSFEPHGSLRVEQNQTSTATELQRFKKDFKPPSVDPQGTDLCMLMLFQARKAFTAEDSNGQTRDVTLQVCSAANLEGYKNLALVEVEGRSHLTYISANSLALGVLKNSDFKNAVDKDLRDLSFADSNYVTSAAGYIVSAARFVRWCNIAWDAVSSLVTVWKNRPSYRPGYRDDLVIGALFPGKRLSDIPGSFPRTARNMITIGLSAARMWFGVIGIVNLALVQLITFRFEFTSYSAADSMLSNNGIFALLYANAIWWTVVPVVAAISTPTFASGSKFAKCAMPLIIPALDFLSPLATQYLGGYGLLGSMNRSVQDAMVPALMTAISWAVNATSGGAVSDFLDSWYSVLPQGVYGQRADDMTYLGVQCTNVNALVVRAEASIDALKYSKRSDIAAAANSILTMTAASIASMTSTAVAMGASFSWYFRTKTACAASLGMRVPAIGHKAASLMRADATADKSGILDRAFFSDSALEVANMSGENKRTLAWKKVATSDSPLRKVDWHSEALTMAWQSFIGDSKTRWIQVSVPNDLYEREEGTNIDSAAENRKGNSSTGGFKIDATKGIVPCLRATFSYETYIDTREFFERTAVADTTTRIGPKTGFTNTTLEVANDTTASLNTLFLFSHGGRSTVSTADKTGPLGRYVTGLNRKDGVSVFGMFCGTACHLPQYGKNFDEKGVRFYPLYDMKGDPTKNRKCPSMPLTDLLSGKLAPQSVIQRKENLGAVGDTENLPPGAVYYAAIAHADNGAADLLKSTFKSVFGDGDGETKRAQILSDSFNFSRTFWPQYEARGVDIKASGRDYWGLVPHALVSYTMLPDMLAVHEPDQTVLKDYWEQIKFATFLTIISKQESPYDHLYAAGLILQHHCLRDTRDFSKGSFKRAFEEQDYGSESSWTSDQNWVPNLSMFDGVFYDSKSHAEFSMDHNYIGRLGFALIEDAVILDARLQTRNLPSMGELYAQFSESMDRFQMLSPCEISIVATLLTDPPNSTRVFENGTYLCDLTKQMSVATSTTLHPHSQLPRSWSVERAKQAAEKEKEEEDSIVHRFRERVAARVRRMVPWGSGAREAAQEEEPANAKKFESKNTCLSGKKIQLKYDDLLFSPKINPVIATFYTPHYIARPGEGQNREFMVDIEWGPLQSVDQSSIRQNRQPRISPEKAQFGSCLLQHVSMQIAAMLVISDYRKILDSPAEDGGFEPMDGYSPFKKRVLMMNVVDEFKNTAGKVIVAPELRNLDAKRTELQTQIDGIEVRIQAQQTIIDAVHSDETEKRDAREAKFGLNAEKNTLQNQLGDLTEEKVRQEYFDYVNSDETEDCFENEGTTADQQEGMRWMLLPSKTSIKRGLFFIGPFMKSMTAVEIHDFIHFHAGLSDKDYQRVLYAMHVCLCATRVLSETEVRTIHTAYDTAYPFLRKYKSDVKVRAARFPSTGGVSVGMSPFELHASAADAYEIGQLFFRMIQSLSRPNLITSTVDGDGMNAPGTIFGDTATVDKAIRMAVGISTVAFDLVSDTGNHKPVQFSLSTLSTKVGSLGGDITRRATDDPLCPIMRISSFVNASMILNRNLVRTMSFMDPLLSRFNFLDQNFRVFSWLFSPYKHSSIEQLQDRVKKCCTHAVGPIVAAEEGSAGRLFTPFAVAVAAGATNHGR